MKKNKNSNGNQFIFLEKYYGLSRGIFIKDRKSGNGVYNQDLSPNALLIEMGGVDNTPEELYAS